MGRNVVGRFEILILLSYEIAESLEEDGLSAAWNVESEQAAVVEEEGDGTY